MKIKYASAIFASVAIAAGAIVYGFEGGSERFVEAPVFVSQSRCTRLTYPKTQRVVRKKKGAPAATAPADGYAGPGTRCTRMTAKHPAAVKILPNKPPEVGLFASLDGLGALRTQDGISLTGNTSGIKLASAAFDADGDTLLYTYTATGGRISGDGPNVAWDLGSVSPGSYTVTVEVDDGCGCIAYTSATLAVN